MASVTETLTSVNLLTIVLGPFVGSALAFLSARQLDDSSQPSTATVAQKPAFSHFSNSTPAEEKLRHSARQGKAQHHPTQVHRAFVRHQAHQVTGAGPGELLHQARHRSGGACQRG